ncbi:hypothetical protein GQ53DRAFT_690791, partial [Thozetella sp. PMI_491]
MPSATRRLPRLPACQLCHQRKVKCDNGRPKCAPCARSGSECLILNPGSDRVISRQYLHELEQRAQDLIVAPRDDLAKVASPDDGSAAESDMSPAGIDGGGFSFMRVLFRDADWRRGDPDPTETEAGAAKLLEAAVEPNQLPSREDANFLFQKYLDGSHEQVPVLLRQDVLRVYESVFPPEPRLLEPSKHDLFRAFIILSIGSVVPYRTGTHHGHPFGYYLSALKNLDTNFLAHGLASIQDLILVCRFGIYHHIGTSIWDIVQLCGRMCVEQGLHKPPDTSMDLIRQQIQRRVFWSYYLMDRYSSTTLNRPFAIADEDITIGFPADVNDQELESPLSPPLSFDSVVSSQPPTSPSEMSVFLLCVRLRQVSSQIHAELSQILHPSGPLSAAPQQPFLLTGHIHTILDQLLKQLEFWRGTAPTFENPRSLYQRQEWYDLLQAREELHLIRKAIDLAPKRNGIPSHGLLALCLEVATRTIRIYASLFRERTVTYTRSYFHMMFTAGLSVMFCISVSTRLSPGAIRDALEALVLGEEILATMGTRMPDARHYITAFEGLRHHIYKKVTHVLNAAPEVDFTTLASSTEPNTEAPPVMYDFQRQSLSHQPPLYSLGPIAPPASGSPLPITQTDAPTDNNILQWAFLSDDPTMWSMEAGLGEYVYGETVPNFEAPQGFDFEL